MTGVSTKERKRVRRRAWLLAATLSLAAGTAAAAPCGNDAKGFPAWLADFKKRAVAAGVSERVVEAALGNASYNRQVIRRDRSQSSFKLSFEEFKKRRAPPGAIAMGRQRLKSNLGILTKVEARFGVPKEIIVAIWGLESGFGTFMGDIPIFSSLPTLAYDCRRSEFFTEELLSALFIVQSGDIPIAQMKGAWAGEIGQTQFLATNYARYAVDFDGDGHPNLIASTPDVFASTANLLAKHGWRPGEDWSEGTRNFEVLYYWNRSMVYRQTIAYFAQELRK